MQKPPSSYPIIIKPEQIAAAGFGVVIFALDLAIPPAAGENVGAGELVDRAALQAQDEPAVFVRVIRFTGETDWLGGDAAHKSFHGSVFRFG